MKRNLNIYKKDNELKGTFNKVKEISQSNTNAEYLKVFDDLGIEVLQ